MEIRKNHLFIKIFIILLIALVLVIPTNMIQNMVVERDQYREQAVQEISSKWGEEQTISGPILAVPFSRFEWRPTETKGNRQKVRVKDMLYILPEDLKINGTVHPEKRYRGIYEVVVYQSHLKMEGTFQLPDITGMDLDTSMIHWENAKVLLGVSDLKGIDEKVKLVWNGVHHEFQPGLPHYGVIQKGIQTPVNMDGTSKEPIRFFTEVSIRGSENLFCLPVGQTSEIVLSSTWPDPKFTGSILPKLRDVSDQGFTAQWNVLDLNRNYPQIWTGGNDDLDDASLGIELLTPVDTYQKTYRSARYAILFIALTFTAFFFVEVIKGKRMHPVQYGLVGAALILFYTLLLSISEHLNFNIAYGIASISTLSLISIYVSSVLRSRALAGLVSLVLVILYAFLFVTLQLQDYALLMGSIGLFTTLGIVMYFSRKVKWEEPTEASER
ncbi:MAG: cell envelope integrity protein CreD [Bacteroidota bacterium]|nr:cell envelope integrity protein CreD [Bacteroidota bacterium]